MRAVCRRLFCAERRGESRRGQGGGLLLVVLLSVLVLVVSGCGRSSFVGRQYDDFTAYYNKFYNAEAAFEERVESIRETDESIDRTRYLSLFLEPSGGSDEAFETVIQKSADVLREHPNSKWVDDALLMIGQSYYYQENYVGAAQKFREVIDLGTERAGAARFWLARTLIANERYEAAAEVLAEGLGSDPEAGTWTARMRMARGELLARQEQWEGAEEALSQGLEGDLPDRLAARGAFLLGQVRQTLGNADGARQAYQAVLDHDPRYALAFAARLSDVELQGRHGDAAEALDRLQDLEQDDKNYEMRGQLAVVRARILRDTGRPDAARRVLRTTMYGDEAPSGASRGRLQYELATLYRDAYEDFSAAAAHFDTAQTSVGRGGEPSDEQRRLPTAPTDAEAQADRFRDLAEQAREVTRLDSLLRLGRMSQEELQAFVADLRERRRAQRENERAAREEAAGGGAQQFGQGGTRQVEQRQASAPATETRESDAGFLFHNDPARVQQGQQQFRQTWGTRGRVDNWRRRAAVRRTQTAEAEEGEATGGAGAGQDEAAGPAGGAAGGVGIDLSAVPRDSARQAEMEAERAVARYELANALFLVAQRPDSAATWYQRVIEENDEHSVADRARYALAEVYRAKDDSAAAREAYRQVIEAAPQSSLAARAREQLGQSTSDSEAGIVPQADTAYARAYETWQAGRLDSAFTRMLDLAHRYPETPAAPRALLASSIIYWRQMQAGAALPPPDSLRRRLPALDSLVTDRLERGANGTASDEERGPPPDSAAAVSPEADTTRRTVDSTRGAARPPDTTATGPDTTGAAAPLTADDVPTDSARGNERAAPPAPAVDSTAGSAREADSTRTPRRPWMLVVASLTQDTSAQDAMSRYRSRWADVGMPVRLCRHETRYRVGLGRFASEEEAHAAKKKWADRLPDAVWTHSCARGREEVLVVSDTVGIADTVAVADTAAAASPDSTRNDSTRASLSPRERYASLDAMLSYLTDQYPEAPQAARAESILELVQERQAADSTAAATGPSRTGRPGRPADSTQASPSDSSRTPGRSEPRQEGSTGADSTTTPRRPLPAPDSAAVDSTASTPQPRSEEE